jgi:RNase P/RNase MRP subunit p29
MKTLLGRIMRVASNIGDGRCAFVEDKVYALWYANKAYNWVPFQHTVNYMSPVGQDRYYGFWALPELYARVLIGQPDNALPNFWVYLGSIYGDGTQMESHAQAPEDKYSQNLTSLAAPIEEAYQNDAYVSQAYGITTPERNRIVLSDVPALTKDSYSNKGVFITSNDKKSIRLQSYSPANTNDAIIISNETHEDNIVLTGGKSSRPTGPRSASINTFGNIDITSRQGSTYILVGSPGNSGPESSGRKLHIHNASLAEGGNSKNLTPLGTIEGNGSITIQSDHNDIEILAIKGRLLIRTKKACQIESEEEVKIISKKDITLQSNEGDINLRSLQGGVNIETSYGDISLQTGAGGVIHLNKTIPGSFIAVPVIPEIFNVVQRGGLI